MITELHLPYAMPMLNGDDGLIREHWAAAKKKVTNLTWEFKAQTKNRHPGAVTITYTRASVQAPDWDNLAASFKHIGDALVAAGIITDDKPTIVLDFDPCYEKAKNNAAACTRIRIEDA